MAGQEILQPDPESWCHDTDDVRNDKTVRAQGSVRRRPGYPSSLTLRRVTGLEISPKRHEGLTVRVRTREQDSWRSVREWMSGRLRSTDPLDRYRGLRLPPLEPVVPSYD